LCFLPPALFSPLTSVLLFSLISGAIVALVISKLKKNVMIPLALGGAVLVIF
jgi:hypothetical protein